MQGKGLRFIGPHHYGGGSKRASGFRLVAQNLNQL